MQGLLANRERVIRAMRVCARNAFLPEAHRAPEEAFLDSPVRLDALDFNVSAPHMHATCLVRASHILGLGWGRAVKCLHWMKRVTWTRPNNFLGK